MSGGYEVALIQASRVQATDGEDEVQVEIIRDDGGVRTHVRLVLSMVGYADLMTGQAKVPCVVRRWGKRCIEK